jgi:hypothetical protein
MAFGEPVEDVENCHVVLVVGGATAGFRHATDRA